MNLPNESLVNTYIIENKLISVGRNWKNLVNNRQLKSD